MKFKTLMKHGGLATSPLVGAATGGIVGAFITSNPTMMGIAMGVGAGGIAGSYLRMKYLQREHKKWRVK